MRGVKYIDECASAEYMIKDKIYMGIIFKEKANSL